MDGLGNRRIPDRLSRRLSRSHLATRRNVKKDTKIDKPGCEIIAHSTQAWMDTASQRRQEDENRFFNPGAGSKAKQRTEMIKRLKTQQKATMLRSDGPSENEMGGIATISPAHV